MNRSAAIAKLARAGLLLLVAAFALAAAPAPAQSTPGGRPLEGAPAVKAGEVPKELDGIGIEDKHGATLPRDVRLTGTDGRSFVLGEYMDGERPLILVLAYYGCPMLCSLVLNGTMSGVKGLEEVAGKDYRVLVVSFDPRDQLEIAREKRKNYVESFGRPLTPIDGSELAAFEFAIGDEAEVERLATTVGFRYRWDAAQDQYAHAAGIFIITPKGVLSQTLTGIEYPPQELSTALKEATREEWHSPLKSVLLYCFQFNPHTGKYSLVAGRALRVAAGVTVMGLLFFVVRMFRADRRKKAEAQPGPS